MSDECLFCKIVRGEIPSEKVFEDEKVLVFKDIHPRAPIHLLIVPKEHIGSLANLSPSDAKILPHLFLTAQKLADQFQVKQKGFRTVFNAGRDSGMEIDHLHLHLLAGGKLGGMG
ncbi:MAG TPA: histidine triad nucleotide-binding protein [Bdellovibrionota bacterium]|nr:histidine triad nucleotide-binding protein [Bdellovibrionota bacterium]